ncbi:MAG: right-handed parallel beta-helix repeat-containing protein [Candidatus Heimdallarchaeota archaeon]|nr:right-handed parallel beta-helix repeat-containing protein [Candidatus Heimdallarchaeota archaeon]
MLLLSNITASNANDKDILMEGLDISNKEYSFYQYDSVTIRNNRLDNVLIDIMDTQEVIISNNIFTNSKDITITIWNVSRLEITENKIFDSRETAIQVFDSPNATITNNVLQLHDSNPNSFAINIGLLINRSPGLILMNNTIKCPLGDGVHFFNSPYSTISSNTISNSGFTAIAIASSTGTFISSNYLVNSSMYKADDAPLSSTLSISDSDNIIIEKNILETSTEAGIMITSVKNMQIYKNKLKNFDIGIFLGLSSNINITENTFQDVDETIEMDQSTDIDIWQNYVLTTNLGRTDNSNLQSTIDETPLIISIMVMTILLRRRRKFNA